MFNGEGEMRAARISTRKCKDLMRLKFRAKLTHRSIARGLVAASTRLRRRANGRDDMRTASYEAL